MYSNDFINDIDSIDRSVTLALNYDGGCVQDFTWLMFSSRLLWVLPALALIVYLAYFKRMPRKAVAVVLALAVIITLCDQTTSTLMKPLFARLRPSHTPGVESFLHYVNGYKGGLYGFASSHAANSFGAVTFVSLLIQRRWVVVALSVLALCVCYSRIYLGVHFFGDVFVGALIGVFWGVCVFWLMTRIERCWQSRHGRQRQ